MKAGAATGSFDELAETYERYRIGYADELYELVIEDRLPAGARVLDVACGTGLVSAEFAARGYDVTGLDISEPMLAHARRRVPQATFVHGAAEALPFEDGAFAALACAQAFHWFDRTPALRELMRVVQPGGIIAVWWKGLMRGDGVRHLREDVATELGLESPRNLLTIGFPGFREAPLADKRLRVIPWLVRMRARDYLGYERSRARARNAFGERVDAYYDLLAERLGDPDAMLSLNYVHHLYLGRVEPASKKR
ncbi:MAG TPA: class I SAM-dependent methyltransferase [Candidatus Baltobacteraceae bacterium]|nr:class I SAM-dependent methyltransferase [Candidatus Baltobacteraceae bacterium]